MTDMIEASAVAPGARGGAAPLKHFRLIRAGIDVGPFLAEIARNAELWPVDTHRQTTVPEQRHTEMIGLRGFAASHAPSTDRQSYRASRWSPSFPITMAFLERFAASIEGELSRVMIVRLAPHRAVSRHVDAGLYYRFRDRFHLVLVSPHGSPLAAGNEAVRMRPGELWWFDNKQPHEARNDGDDWRVHVIFDVLPQRHAGAVAKIRHAQAEFDRPLETVLPDPRLARLHAAIRDRCIFYSSQAQPLLSPDGREIRWLIDLRLIFMDGALIQSIAALFWERFADRLPFQVGGLEAGAIPLITAILIEGERRGTPINGFWMRKERKPYGRTKRLEGVLTRDPVVIVDDLLNSGGTAEQLRVVIADVAAESGAAPAPPLADLFCVIDYGARDGRAWLAAHGVTLTSLFALRHFDLTLDQPTAAELPPCFSGVWEFKPARPGSHFHVVPKAAPALDEERIYCATDAGELIALELATGRVCWQLKTTDTTGKGIFSSPALHDGRVYVGGYDGNLYCLDIATGAEIWRFSGADWIGSSPALAPARGLLFVGLEHARAVRKGGLVALRLADGAKLWERGVAEYVHGSPLYCAELDAVAVGANDGGVILVEATTGTLIWRFDTGGPVKGGLALDAKSGDLVFGSDSGRIHVLDVKAGTERWSVETGDVVYTTPLIAYGYAYVGSTDKHLYVLDLVNRAVVDRLLVKGRVYAAPRLIDNRVYVGTTGGHLLEYHTVRRTITGAARFPDAITNPVAYSARHGLFYVQTNDNRLFAVRRAEA